MHIHEDKAGCQLFKILDFLIIKFSDTNQAVRAGKGGYVVGIRAKGADNVDMVLRAVIFHAEAHG